MSNAQDWMRIVKHYLPTCLVDGIIKTAMIEDDAITKDKLATDVLRYGVQTKSENYAIVLADHRSVINVTATSTQTLPDAATVGEGWGVIVRSGADSIFVAVAAAGSDTIEYGRDAALTSVGFAKRGDFIEIVSTGSSWLVIDSKVSVQIHGYASTAQSIATGTTTTIEWDAVNDDTHSGWEAVTEDRYTCPFAGEYEVKAMIDFDTPAAFDAVLTAWRDNGTEYEMVGRSNQMQADTTGNSYSSLFISGSITCSKDDEIYFQVWHNRGSNLDIHDGTNLARNYFDIRRVQS
ncbi:hypothetical protein [Thalassospira aquimaris]|uniref:Uncharacterized protein n=1 Tax=Thalassospira aquimaris TaxID=3037796 RepID=A0ABT6GHQ7_9PROT|nr:hypothetical protein [Thalassospira sp. FZY0004]MDG4721581.1 hypothetical protein [Thalassospira sp. FZY0004]